MGESEDITVSTAPMHEHGCRVFFRGSTSEDSDPRVSFTRRHEKILVLIHIIQGCLKIRRAREQRYASVGDHTSRLVWTEARLPAGH